MSDRLTPRQRRALHDLPPAPAADTSTADKIAALESELALLEPYASTKGLARLKARIDALRLAIAKLRGLPLDD